MPSTTFLSDAWLDQARTVKAEHAGTPIDQPGFVVNATITGTPFADAALELHSSHGPVIGWERGLADDAGLSFTLDYALARELLLARDFDVLDQAIASGALAVEGDLSSLRTWWSHRTGNPDAVALDDEIRDLTA